MCIRDSRFVVLGSYGALWAGAPMVGVGAVMLAVGVATQAETAREVTAANPVGLGLEDCVLEPIGPDSRRYLLFSLNELLLYNLPLVVFTLVDAKSELLYVGVWTRLFQLIVLPMRMLVDARVNRQTASWFRGDIALLRRELAQSLGMASAAMVAALMMLGLVAAPLLDWLGLPVLNRDAWLVAGLAMWGVGNVVQHVYGSFTLSYGAGFSAAVKVSWRAAAAVGVAFLVARSAGLGVGASLTAMGGAYLFSAFAYRAHVQRLLARHREAAQ